VFAWIQAIDMYNAAGMWEEAHHLASKYMDHSEVTKKLCGENEK
jgi:hypothetical protein